jgi:hypothetical protein
MTKRQIQKLCLLVRKEIRSLDIFESNLGGSCGLASLILTKKLSELGIRSQIYWEGIGYHIWIETKEFLIDPTYSQINSRIPVLIIKKNTPEFKKHLNTLEERNKGTKHSCLKQYSWIKKKQPDHVISISHL